MNQFILLVISLAFSTFNVAETTTPISETPVNVDQTTIKVTAPALEVIKIIAVNSNNKTLLIDPKKSSATIKVYRSGFFSSLGHNHTVSINALSGSINLASPMAKSTATIQFKVHNLQVDNNEDRAKAGDGFGSDVSQKDKDGTTENMLGKYVLNAAKYPTITLAVMAVNGKMDNLKILTDITIQNVTVRKIIPAKGFWIDNNLKITGNFAILQTAFGITPFSILAGAVAIQDKLDIQFIIETKQTKRSTK